MKAFGHIPGVLSKISTCSECIKNKDGAMILNKVSQSSQHRRTAGLTCTGPHHASPHLPSLVLQMLDLLSNDCQLVSSVCSDEFISLQRRENQTVG